jgi:midasin
MTKLCEGKQFLSSATAEKIQMMMKNIHVVMSHAQIILNTCPEENFTSSETSEIVILKPEPLQFIQYKYDSLWNKANNLIKEILNAANKLTVDLEKSKGDIPDFEFNVIKLKFIPLSDSNSIESKLDGIKANVETLISIFGRIHLTESFSWLMSEIDETKITMNEDFNADFNVEAPVNKLHNLADTLSDKISQVIEAIHRKYLGQTSDVSLEDSEDTQVEEEHLKILIAENLENDFKELSIATILNLCHEIAECLFVVPPDQLEEPKTLISYVIPLLEQIILYHQYFLTQQVSTYRIICKMNSVLLNIFIDLASKGFCVPPELVDDSEEGTGKPSDGLGLGEGQGERDVSDRIESEDQLDDAQPAGQDKEKEDDKDCKEEEKGIEMSEDFDSKLQDVEPKEGEDDDDDDSNSDADEQMGETEKDANKQDKETFGSDDENNEDNVNEGNCCLN